MVVQEGGFAVRFVEKPPKEIQSECPVCLQVLRDPYQVKCCGYGFCHVCIERVRADNKPCPCCKAEGFDCFEDKGRRRSLYGYHVYCENEKLGCQWVGELGKFENHLNSKPSQDKQLEGCPYTKVQCLHGSEPFERSSVEAHQNEKCPDRSFSCKHCKEYDSTYKDVTTKHWPVCGSFPVQCPKKCSDETMKRLDLESHIANDCPLTIVDCDFKSIGCEAKLPRKRLSSHLTDSKAQAAHMLLQTKQLMLLKEENKQLKQQIEKLTKDFEKYQIGTPLCPVELIITNFEKHKKDGDYWSSPPFYTHPKGYKMCLVVYAGGCGDGVNTHISLFLTLMKGEYDEQLKWPLRGNFTIHLMSQDGDERYSHIRTITYDISTSGSNENCNRVVDGKVSLGTYKFIAHSMLKPMYLQNDYLKFYIKKVDLY